MQRHGKLSARLVPFSIQPISAAVIPRHAFQHAGERLFERFSS
jgi:hypothetical protein